MKKIHYYSKHLKIKNAYFSIMFTKSLKHFTLLSWSFYSGKTVFEHRFTILNVQFRIDDNNYPF